jgi:hypothetical protein
VAFEERLKELGYVKGSNITYEHRFAGGRTERLPEIARELAALNVDVIIAGNNASTLGTPEGGRSPSITRGCRLESAVPRTSVRLESDRDRRESALHTIAINRGPTT